MMNPSPVHAPYVSASWRANVVKVLLVAGAVLSGVAIITGVLELALPWLADVEAEDNLGAILFAFSNFGLVVLTIMVYLTTVVFFSIWLYRSHENLKSFGHWTRNLQYSSGWAVGSFFVPFANLVIPYRAIKELWQNSVPVEETRFGLGEVPSWFPLWWFFWLTSNFVARIHLRMSFNDDMSHESTAIVGIIADALAIGAAIFAFVIVRTITNRQEETSANLKLAAFAGPPLPDFGNIQPSSGSVDQLDSHRTL